MWEKNLFLMVKCTIFYQYTSNCAEITMLSDFVGACDNHFKKNFKVNDIMQKSKIAFIKNS